MQIKIGDVLLQLEKSYYNKTIVQPDGITHIVDTSKSYPYYQLGIAKNYFDINSKEQALSEIITDLKDVIEQLELQLNKSKDSKDKDDNEIEF